MPRIVYHNPGQGITRPIFANPLGGMEGPSLLPRQKIFALPMAQALRRARGGGCLLDSFCQRQGIVHKLIRPRTPEHNGKVERSHRIDQERFYRTLSFHSLGDLREQGSRWMKRYNSTPRMALGLKTPDQVEFAKLGELMLTTGEIRCPKLGRRLTSSDS